MNAAADDNLLRVLDRGLLAYESAVALQHQVHAQVLEGGAPDTLILLEHPPVITVSQRRSASEHLLADASHLHKLGIAVAPTDRGGDITYHGPGQLVAYPIIRLRPLNLNLGRYMRLLEQVVIETVRAFGVTADRVAGATGVWVGDAKLCAMGVRIRRDVTLHGLALNVTTNLDHFQTIVPCGMHGKSVTSLSQLLGGDAPDMASVKAELARVFSDHVQALRRTATNLNSRSASSQK